MFRFGRIRTILAVVILLLVARALIESASPGNAPVTASPTTVPVAGSTAVIARAPTPRPSATKPSAATAASISSAPVAFTMSRRAQSDESAADSCDIASIDKSPIAGFQNWSPDGTHYMALRKDGRGFYQVYVGEFASGTETCITCGEHVGLPSADLNHLMPVWHPSGNYVTVGVEIPNHWKPALVPDALVESLLQDGEFLNMYAGTPDGAKWWQLTNLKSTEADGFVGPALPPDGGTAAWTRLVNGNILQYQFAKWDLNLSDFKIAADGTPSLVNTRNITPTGGNWFEPANFAPDGERLLLTTDIGLKDAQGMDQWVYNVRTGQLDNLTNSPDVWDEHGVFAPNGDKIAFMSSYPYRSDPSSYKTLSLRTEFMLMDSDGSNLRQLTHFNQRGYPEYTDERSVAAGPAWSPDGSQLAAAQLLAGGHFPAQVTWIISFKGNCGGDGSLH